LIEHLTALSEGMFRNLLVEVRRQSQMRPLASIVEVLSGGTPRTSEPKFWGGGIPWFSVVDAPSEHDVWILGTAKTITSEGLVNSPTQLVPEGATIISARGTVGKTGIVGVPMAMNQSCYALKSLIGSRGFFLFFTINAAVAELQRGAHGSVFDTITKASFDNIQVSVPSETEVDGFEAIVGPLLDQVRASLYEIRQLRTVRDELLPLLMSGRISVREVAA
jgi:type I restriction enzyme S subunit